MYAYVIVLKKIYVYTPTNDRYSIVYSSVPLVATIKRLLFFNGQVSIGAISRLLVADHYTSFFLTPIKKNLVLSY